MSILDRDALLGAIWARVSTDDQHTENQLHELRAWAERRGVTVVREFVIEDSAWASKGNGKGAEFDRQRGELLDGARMAHYNVVLTWGLDRLSRRGAEDMHTFVRRLTEGTGCALWSRKDPWVESLTDPMARELLLGMMATLARFESERRSERIRAGLARRKREGKPVGGRKPGAKDKRPRERKTGAAAGWTEERRRALRERNQQQRAAAEAGRDEGTS